MQQIAQDNYELLLADQIEKVESLAHYQDLFHPAYANNFSIVLANKKVNLAESKESVSSAMRRLNVANFNLYRLCNLLTEEKSLDQLPQKDELLNVLGRWKKLIDAGNSFLCFDYAQTVVKGMELAGIPIIKTLEEPRYVAIVNEFKSLSFKFKSFFKLSVYGGFDDLYACLENLFDSFNENPQLFYYLERCEVAKEHFPTDMSQNSALFPVFSIFFDKTVVTSRHNPLPGIVAKEIREVFANAKEPDSMMYLDSLGKGVTISQGYKSYKKFLKLIKVIDEVYDAETNYAYLNQ